MRKRFHAVYDPDPATCIHVNTEISTCLLILDRESIVIFSISATIFLLVQQTIGADSLHRRGTLSLSYWYPGSGVVFDCIDC